MDARKKACVVVALSEFIKLQNRFLLHLKNVSEEDERRRRLLMILLEREQIFTEPGGRWEEMPNADPSAFVRHFRLTKTQFFYLLMQLQVNGLKEGPAPPVSVAKKVLMFLWFMANQGDFSDMSDKFAVPPPSAYGIISEVLKVISTMGRTFVSWPSDGQRASSAAAFLRLSGLGGVIGAIDGCHIRMRRPAVRGGDYINHRSFYSILLQAVVDEGGRFTDIFAGPPGRVRDERMLRESTFYAAWREKMGDYRLLGDAAYAGEDFPFILATKADDEALTEADRQQNAQIRRGREVVERAFGRLKCRWRRLRDLQSVRLDVAVMTVLAACFLHNLSDGTSESCWEHPEGCPRLDDHNE
ncbi:uncharacterized protein LOC106534454 [Austrofundulus limnaeus]|uniref:Uncharacterized protein LOC106534454 n=1 Tax=Austrofundulus limnaeus TaxID=52670 RepID=A0A2I4D2T4_AUSLI|nr:PREDICTED: uncharacterized protein LOC106534454 [Austrofundulus limnaeus]